jgi:hypothetical protein
MAHPTYLDSTGTPRSRKATGAGTDPSPDVLHNIIDSGTINITDLTAANTARTTATTVLPVQAIGPSGLTKAQALPSVVGDCHAPADNTSAVVTYGAAGAGVKHYLYDIFFGYDSTLTVVGTVAVTDDGATVFGPLPVTVAGVGQLHFDPPIVSAVANKAMVVTLTTGGATVQGVLSCRHEAR